MRGRAEDGAIVVEFGVMFPLVALMIAGAVAFGLAYSAQLTLQQAAREGVRVYTLGSGDPVATAQNAASNLSGVSVTTSGDCPDPDAPGNPAPNSWVQTAYTFSVPVPFVPISTMDLTARAVMRCGG